MNLAPERRRRIVASHSIHIGGVFASRKPAIIRTVLGSCISVCLHDPFAGVGGMNHFMLPLGDANNGVSARYGIHAMEILINACMKAGAERSRMEAKVFGGGHVITVRESLDNVPNSNIRFALEFLATENIPLVARDVGGYDAREIYFFTDTGLVLLKRIECSTRRTALLSTMLREERARMREKAAPADDSNVTLF